MYSIDSVPAQFILFCQQRCRQEWPVFYDEMCMVAGQRLFRDMGYKELSEAGLPLDLDNLGKTSNMVKEVIAKASLEETRV